MSKEGIAYYNNLINELLANGTQNSTLLFITFYPSFLQLKLIGLFAIMNRPTALYNPLPLGPSSSPRRWVWWFLKSPHCVSYSTFFPCSLNCPCIRQPLLHNNNIIFAVDNYFWHNLKTKVKILIKTLITVC